MNYITQKKKKSQENNKSFIKAYKEFFTVTKDLSKVSYNIFSYFYTHVLEYNNVAFYIFKSDKKRIAEHFGYNGYGVINEHIKKLKDKKLFLKNKATASYRINPIYIFKGELESEAKIKESKFIEIYNDLYPVIKDLPRVPRNIYFFICNYKLKYNGKNICLDKENKEKMAKHFGYKKSVMIDEYLVILKRRGLLLKTKYKLRLIVNPIYVWKGLSSVREKRIQELKKNGIL